MKYVVLNPGSRLSGKVAVPSSKSIGHRAVICAGLSEGISNLYNVNYSQDIEATLRAMKIMGASMKKCGKSLKIKGAETLNPGEKIIDCAESGSTLRFMIPIAALTGKKMVFDGRGELVERPLDPYYKIFEDKNVKYKTLNGKLPLTIEGILRGGEYRVKGNISSQFISGLMFALPLAEEDSEIKIDGELKSKPYVDLTMDVLKEFSVYVQNNNYKEFRIKGGQKFKARDFAIEGDFSQAAFWLAAGTLGGNIGCEGLNIKSLQGDKAILKIIENMGGKVLIEKDYIKSLPSYTKGIEFDASDCPDLVPVVAVLGALSDGTTRIVNAERLRIKECDRLRAICTELGKIGAEIEETEGGMIVKGKRCLNGGNVNSWGDHRIAMALAIASLKCNGRMIIKDADCIKKSYPDFWQHFKMLGGEIDEWSVG